MFNIFGNKKDEKNKAVVIMNEQHSLLPEQQQILVNLEKDWLEDGDEIHYFKVPAEGLKKESIEELEKELSAPAIYHNSAVKVVIVSPIPYLLARLALSYHRTDGLVHFEVFHNDQREKVELPNGRIIHKVAKEGWELL